jgi:hypothetical protein
MRNSPVEAAGVRFEIEPGLDGLGGMRRGHENSFVASSLYFHPRTKEAQH